MDYEYAEKPARNEAYFRNLQLKSKTKKIVESLGGESLKEKWTNCNFKKNTGYKPIYSCHGYGGKCSGCKNDIDEIHQNKQQIKRNVKDDIKEWKSSQLE